MVRTSVTHWWILRGTLSVAIYNLYTLHSYRKKQTCQESRRCSIRECMTECFVVVTLLIKLLVLNLETFAFVFDNLLYLVTSNFIFLYTSLLFHGERQASFVIHTD